MHAKYIKKKGKLYGPYYYESYRDSSGKVKKRYIGMELKEKKFTLHQNYFVLAAILFLIISAAGLFYLSREQTIANELNIFSTNIQSSFVNTFSSLKSSITGFTTIENVTVSENITASNENNLTNNNLSENQTIDNSSESLIDNTTQQPNNESLNITTLNNSLNLSKLNADVSIEAVKVEINKPVKWVKKVKLDKKSNVSINVPSVSSNIVVKKVEDLGNIEVIKDVKIKDDVLGITGFSVLGSNENQRFSDLQTKFKDLEFGISKIFNFIKELSEFRFTGYSVLDADNITLVVNDDSDEYIVEYETPGPIATEKILTDSSKEISISSDYSYTNVLSYTSLSDSFNDVIVTWVTRDTDEGLQIKKIDLNGNGLLDKVEWITPHLSTQVFRINETNSTTGFPIVYNNTFSYQENVTLAGNVSNNYTNFGIYTSLVLDPGSSTTWNNISWIEEVPYGEELPNNGLDEINLGLSGGANMSGNVLLMHFNNVSSYGENESNVTDFSGRGNHGTSSGTGVPRTNTTDKIFGAASKTFDGVNDYIDTNNIFPFATTMTATAWIKTKSLVNAGIFLCNLRTDSGGTSINKGWCLRVLDGGEFRVFVTGVGVSEIVVDSGRIVNDNKWHQVALVRDGSTGSGTIKTYVDGVTGNTGDAAGFNWESTYTTKIGEEGDIRLPFNGLIDEVSIWNRSLTAAEIRNHYLRGVLNLTFQVRSCDDAACNGENFVGGDNTVNTFFRNATYGNMVNITTNRWFQYKAYFTSQSVSYTPILQELIVRGNSSTQQVLINHTNSSAFEEMYNRTTSDGENVTLNKNVSGNYSTMPVAGVFTSQITDAGSSSTWNNISWIEEVPYGEELPNNGIDEINLGLPGGANMSGNVLLMHFNNQSSYGENESNVTDFSGLGNHGTSSGTSVPRTNTTDKVFGAASKTFDGSNDYIDLGTNLDQNGAVTITAWINAKSVTGIKEIVTNSNNVGSATDYALEVGRTTSRLSALRSAAAVSVTGNTNLQTNIWYHIAVTMSGSSGSWTVTLYLNGANDGSAIDTNNPNGVNEITAIGRTGAYSQYYFNGSIDEVAIWNRTLSATEIKNQYLRGILNLTFQVRSCDDAACNGENFVGGDNTVNTFFKNATFNSLSNITSNRYFQYKAYFITQNIGYTPVLQEVNTFYTYTLSSTKFIIQNSTSNIASIDSGGYMFITGTSAQSQATLTPPPKSFVLQDITGNVIAYINNTGFLFLKGKVFEKATMTLTTNSSLEVRDSSNALVAFFDNLGNLSLKNSLSQQYATP